MLARTLTTITLASVATISSDANAQRMSEEHRQRAERIIDRGIEFLRSQQDEATGGWSIPEEGPVFPAITGLAISAMCGDPEIDYRDPDVARGIAFIESFMQPDGGFYDRVLPAYNTAMCVSALADSGKPTAGDAMASAVDYLVSMQWSEDSLAQGGEPAGVDRDHPFYGGVGYGGNGRPDGSNMHFFMRALEDAGVSSDSEPVQRALVYLERVQMDDEINDMEYAEGSDQGGFIYATSPDKDSIGVGESKAGTIAETLEDGSQITRLRSYGSMTYAGFKSYVYADLDRDDPRVQAALRWISERYSLEENPGIGDQGRYYFYMTFGRALGAWDEDTIEVIENDGSATRDVKWAEDLVEKLEEMQNEDGSFRSVHPRWMEDNPVLITSYALIGLHDAMGR